MLKSSLFTFVFCILPVIAISPALIPTVARGVPEASWEQFPEGVAVALSLSSPKETDKVKDFLNVYIKNTSSGVLQFVDYGGPGVRISYIGADGKTILLHDYLDGFILHNKGPISIRPGATYQRRVYVMPAEFSILTAHAVSCGIEIVDPVARKGYKIETAPQTLSIEP